MTVLNAILELGALPPNAILMAPSQGDGGSVPVQGFVDVDATPAPLTEPVHWVDVIFCEDEYRFDYGLAPRSEQSALGEARERSEQMSQLALTLSHEAQRLANLVPVLLEQPLCYHIKTYCGPVTP